MNPKVTFHQVIPFVFLLLFVGIVAMFVLNLSNLQTIQAIPNVSNNQIAADAFDYEQAADVSAQRWLAMAKFYEAEGLLTREDFDYEQAADVMAYRWQAMGRAYERMGMLNER